MSTRRTPWQRLAGWRPQRGRRARPATRGRQRMRRPAPRPLRRNPMTRVSPRCVLSLTGGLLVASLVCGGSTVASALARPGADGRPLALAGSSPQPSSRVHTALASWYGTRWQGRRTASGARYDQHQLTAAHRTAPFGTEAVVTNLANGTWSGTDHGSGTPHTPADSLSLLRGRPAARDAATGTTRVQVEWLTAAPPRA